MRMCASCQVNWAVVDMNHGRFVLASKVLRMPTFPLAFLPRALHCALIGLGLLGIGATAGASEHTAAGKPESAAASQVEIGAAPIPTRVPGDKPRDEPRAAALPASQDAMGKLRERLAQKLGAAKGQDANNPTIMRVVSRPILQVAADRDVRVDRSAMHGSTATHTMPNSTAERNNPPMSGVAPGHAHWDYVGDARPESWGQLKPEFSKCASGTRQSPIDIRDGIQVNLDPVQFDYKPSNFNVIDNGHTVQVNVGAGNSIEVMGRRYDLIQFHFHRPSEERINGKQFDMVAHLVHKDMDGRLAVVAVLLDRGSALPIVQSVWNNLPLEKGEEVSARTSLDMRELLPLERGYFTYMGSLTTPPCSEGVLWMVMKTPLPISAEQIRIFARLYPMNARPIQSAGGRLIKESN